MVENQKYAVLYKNSKKEWPMAWGRVISERGNFIKVTEICWKGRTVKNTVVCDWSADACNLYPSLEEAQEACEGTVEAKALSYK